MTLPTTLSAAQREISALSARVAELEQAAKTARVDALREALGIADAAIKKYAAATYSKEPVKVFKAGDDTSSQSAAKCYCAGEIYAGIEDLIEGDTNG
ncbi:hypothetical protein [Pseudosulfitobacter pseudonitzschiae]|uniref:hypothetical protein n=1 Tax=Pseudosulfitobacter pseudonitzschiae TaxID=1402135 RepID=UPI001AF75081|nr:hypothetical protein [Pseudosulfitobacter pseudonitzschiae]MBM1817195.1 hypothetical protein [Pseudosulfitobacter pseudonitzschiae]MBM1834206.1 hypothetical protein [Pseudosulfitobacter pseudonitzschiae]MBM1839071.1 hypothetical protein [Pseudosulfitobacter pseudonitzschiae]MBM1843919.1 hypothetical protein [Pseudosulfitobacter pseudonitzschiae]MBM1848756.1 hypothetical protein [Pseudosulfitobacter pseudonitzschiae]